MLLYPKGYKVLDSYGFYVCSVTEDIHTGEYVRVEQFTDWQIAVPETEDPIHPAIGKLIEDSFSLVHKNEKIKCQLTDKNPSRWRWLKDYIKRMLGYV